MLSRFFLDRPVFAFGPVQCDEGDVGTQILKPRYEIRPEVHRLDLMAQVEQGFAHPTAGPQRYPALQGAPALEQRDLHGAPRGVPSGPSTGGSGISPVIVSYRNICSPAASPIRRIPSMIRSSVTPLKFRRIEFAPRPST